MTGGDDYAYAWPLTETVGSSQLTVEAWVQFDEAPHSLFPETLVAAVHAGIDTQWHLTTLGDRLWFALYGPCCPSTLAGAYTEELLLQPGEWYHVAAVYDGLGATNEDRLQIYVNRESKALTFSGTLPSTLSTDEPAVRLGHMTGVGFDTTPLKGNLDEVRIYTVARSFGEIYEDAGGDVAPTQPPPPAQPTPDPVPGAPLAYWTMNELNGTTVVDSSGNNHDLYLADALAAPTLSVTDKPTLLVANVSSLAFDGIDDYAYALPLTATAGNSALTAEAWVQFDDPPHSLFPEPIVMAVDAGLATQWHLSTLGNELWFNFYGPCCPSNTQAAAATVGVNLQQGQWYHVAAVYDGGGVTNAQRLAIYVNGRRYPVGYFSTVPSVLSTDQPTIRLGQANGVGFTTAALYGKLDEVRIYGVARSSTDIANDAAGQTFSTNSPPAIVFDHGLVEFDEGKTATNTGAFTDVNATDNVTLSASIGVISKTGGSSGTWNWSYPTMEGPADSQSVVITADDGQGGSNSVTFALVVNNVAAMVGAISGTADPVQVNTSIHTNANFVDTGVLDLHTALWNWGDDSSSVGTVTEAGGAGSVTGSHTYTATGVYLLQLTVTDDEGDSSIPTFEYVVVYDPQAGFVTGSGSIESPPGAYAAVSGLTGIAKFRFTSRYQRGANVPTGTTQFRFQVANLNFQSTNYQWLVISGDKAKFKGFGTINGVGGYGFLLTATDGLLPGHGGADMLRIMIWDNANNVIYDNQNGDPPGADATTELVAGSIVIHK
ncbi:MAG: hypothetical protein IT318_16025 [Anaerolineales bacterium]|nr:hypothetical protein [Anaerolineales bacterium]